MQVHAIRHFLVLRVHVVAHLGHHLRHVLRLVRHLTVLLNEVGQTNLSLIPTANLDDSQHRLTVGLREVVDDDIHAVTDNTDTLGLEDASALLD